MSYDDAPATVDADDPAIWVHRQRPADSLVIATLKDAGLVVYDLRGKNRSTAGAAESAADFTAGSADTGRSQCRPGAPCARERGRDVRALQQRGRRATG